MSKERLARLAGWIAWALMIGLAAFWIWALLHGGFNVGSTSVKDHLNAKYP